MTIHKTPSQINDELFLNKFKFDPSQSTVDPTNDKDYQTDVHDMSIADRLFILAVMFMAWIIIVYCTDITFLLFK